MSPRLAELRRGLAARALGTLTLFQFLFSLIRSRRRK